MFNFFKKNKKEKNQHQPRLADLDGNSLSAGDTVMSFRYDLGKCKLIQGEKGLVYQSVETGKQVSWALMVDASTDLQKVKKITET